VILFTSEDPSEHQRICQSVIDGIKSLGEDPSEREADSCTAFTMSLSTPPSRGSISNSHNYVQPYSKSSQDMCDEFNGNIRGDRCPRSTERSHEADSSFNGDTKLITIDPIYREGSGEGVCNDGESSRRPGSPGKEIGWRPSLGPIPVVEQTVFSKASMNLSLTGRDIRGRCSLIEEVVASVVMRISGLLEPLFVKRNQYRVGSDRVRELVDEQSLAHHWTVLSSILANFTFESTVHCEAAGRGERIKNDTRRYWSVLVSKSAQRKIFLLVDKIFGTFRDELSRTRQRMETLLRESDRKCRGRGAELQQSFRTKRNGQRVPIWSEDLEAAIMDKSSLEIQPNNNRRDETDNPRGFSPSTSNKNNDENSGPQRSLLVREMPLLSVLCSQPLFGTVLRAIISFFNFHDNAVEVQIALNKSCQYSGEKRLIKLVEQVYGAANRLLAKTRASTFQVKSITFQSPRFICTHIFSFMTV